MDLLWAARDAPLFFPRRYLAAALVLQGAWRRRAARLQMAPQLLAARRSALPALHAGHAPLVFGNNPCLLAGCDCQSAAEGEQAALRPLAIVSIGGAHTEMLFTEAELALPPSPRSAAVAVQAAWRGARCRTALQAGATIRRRAKAAAACTEGIALMLLRSEYRVMCALDPAISPPYACAGSSSAGKRSCQLLLHSSCH